LAGLNVMVMALSVLGHPDRRPASDLQRTRLSADHWTLIDFAWMADDVNVFVNLSAWPMHWAACCRRAYKGRLFVAPECRLHSSVKR